MEFEKIVLDTLKRSDHPLKGKEIAEIAGIDKKDVDKAIKNLKKEQKIHSPKNCFYSVTE